jgi:DNA-binding NtrC family response regulator
MEAVAESPGSILKPLPVTAPKEAHREFVAMPKPTALLVSQDNSVIAAVQGACASLHHLDLDVRRKLAPACRRVRQEDVVMVLAHLPAVGGEVGSARLLGAIAEASRPCPTLMLVDRYSEPQAEALIRAGAAGCLALPDDLETAVRLAGVLTSRACAPTARPGLSAEGNETDAAPEVMAQLRRVAPQDTTLLFTGETGTGKTRLARLVHKLSPRRDQPFLVLDCGSLSASLIESELFGHVKGAFTGADRDRAGKLVAAGRGTLLLDEINSLPLALQAKLLRALDERMFEPVGSNKPQPLQARLIAASNAPLEHEVAEGRFRQDLYFRLSVVGFYLPPLRERRGRIVPLAKRFLAELAVQNRPDVVGITAEALGALELYDWPGNVRELRNVIERAVALCPQEEVGLNDLPDLVRRPDTRPPEPPPGPSPLFTLHDSMRQTEIQRIREALAKHQNNRLRAAAELGISRKGLYKKLHKYDLLRGA